jgi:hypothetical protein
MRRLWTKATCNWLVLGLQCALNGHDWRQAGVWTVERSFPERRSEFLLMSSCGNCGRGGGYHYHAAPGIRDCWVCKRNGVIR